MPWPTTYPFFHVDQPEQVDNAALLRRLQRPEGPVDVVLDTDTYNEIDDQYALAYLIKNDEKLKLKAIYAAPFCNNKAATPAIGMQKSYDEIKNILSLMGRTDLLDCTYRGSESYLPDEKTPVESDAARHLAQLAMQYTPEKPLYVIAIAAITNVASALLMKPEIRDRIVLVWLGGNALHWHDNHEFNLFQDIAGARVALGCGAAVVLVPCMGVVDAFATPLPSCARTCWARTPCAITCATTPLASATAIKRLPAGLSPSGMLPRLAGCWTAASCRMKSSKAPSRSTTIAGVRISAAT